MALNSSHIQFLKSARLTDQVDGGGQITATPLPDNVSNNLFPGVSNLDAVNGRVSARLLYLATVSPDTLWYYGAGVYLSAPPENSAISALLARASAFGEERADLITRVESYLTQGPITRYAGIQRSLRERKVNYAMTYRGAQRFAVGLAKKVLLADYAGRVISDLAVSRSDGNLVGAWFSALLFFYQIVLAAQ